jgi:hypothetical protein
MTTKDFLIIAFVPLALLLIPLGGSLTVEGWNWTFSDFVFAWAMFAFATFALRLLITRKWADFSYRAGAALAVIGGFLLTWVNLAVQVIGDDNPGNGLYFLVILAGMIGVGLSRFEALGLSKVAFAMAAALLAIPVIAVFVWPTDFSPGFARVFVLNGFFVAMFTGAGLLFRRSAGQARTLDSATTA